MLLYCNNNHEAVSTTRVGATNWPRGLECEVHVRSKLAPKRTCGPFEVQIVISQLFCFHRGPLASY